MIYCKVGKCPIDLKTSLCCIYCSKNKNCPNACKNTNKKTLCRGLKIKKSIIQSYIKIGNKSNRRFEMKKLSIKSEGCSLKISKYSIEVNGRDFKDIIKDNLPKLKEYENYPIKLDISIEFLGDERLVITPVGYDIPKDVEEDE